MTSAPSGVHLRMVLWKAERAMENVDRRSIDKLGLGLSDFAVLEMLLHKGPQPVNTIGAKVLLTSGSITAAVDRLEARGLVRRANDPQDRRARIVHLTPPGRKLITCAFAEHSNTMENAAAILSPSQRSTLVRLLKKLGKSCGAA
ncbi:MAG: MarR family winged helix-turn-helix transcriptional regulator [Acidobacteriota bacterium]|nr:MarR family winged helix-turn-helix transcriptional regulator [Acidobacteriota bacterium]